MYQTPNSPTAAKFEREKKDRPRDWIISKDGTRLIYIGSDKSQGNG